MGYLRDNNTYVGVMTTSWLPKQKAEYRDNNKKHKSSSPRLTYVEDTITDIPHTVLIICVVCENIIASRTVTKQSKYL